MSWRKNGLGKIIEQLPLGIAVTLPIGTLVYANPSLCQLLGLTCDAVVDMPLAHFIVAGDDPSPMDGSPRIDEKRLRAGNGEIFDVLESVYPLHDDDDAQRITHFIHLVQDLRAQKKLNNLSRLAFYDGLTALPNRNLLSDRLERAPRLPEQLPYGIRMCPPPPEPQGEQGFLAVE